MLLLCIWLYALPICYNAALGKLSFNANKVDYLNFGVYLCTMCLHNYVDCIDYYIWSFILYIITGGDDYAPEQFNVAIAAGETNVPLSIVIIDDDIFEGNESFNISVDLSSLPDRVLVQPHCVLMVTIVDNDGVLLSKTGVLKVSWFLGL